jgi:hypothetical protein
MPKTFSIVVCCLFLAAFGGLANAQDQAEERVFNLVVGERADAEVVQEVEQVERYVPAIEAGRWDLTLTLGNLGMNKTLLQFDRLIYKATEEHYYYGDIELVSQPAFNPMLRLGYNLTSWFALETQFGVTFSDYEGSITNPFLVNPFGGTPESVPELGKFDPERRSSLIFVGNLNGVWYPLNMDGDGRGRVHPYVTGGIGQALYNLDSNYIDDPATSLNLNGGIGVRLIADKLIAARVEVLYQHHTIEFEPAEWFDVRDAETVRIPVYRFDPFGNYRPVEQYRKNTLGGLTWQVGFTVSF